MGVREVAFYLFRLSPPGVFRRPCDERATNVVVMLVRLFGHRAISGGSEIDSGDSELRPTGLERGAEGHTLNRILLKIPSSRHKKFWFRLYA